nr:retrovirus-related Pol polyprotein from transposon TNT 1-94 [Tanacetum cinerariifolium]
MAKQLSATSAHECLFVDFLFEEEPKKQEGIDYDETFAPVVRFEAIRIFVAFATYMNFIVYQMDVKSAFLSGFGLKGYSDSDYAGCSMDRKSTLGAYQLLGGDTELQFIPTQYQLADIFTKPLDEIRLIVELGGIRGEISITTFRNALRAHYLPHSNEYVSSPSLEVVRLWFVTIGYNREIGAKGTLKKSCLPLRSAGNGLKTAQTNSGTNKESKSDEISKKIKLEDLLDLIKDTRSGFLTPDSSQDEPFIVLDESEEEETVKDEDTHTTSHDVPKDTSVPHPPSLKLA